MNALAKNLSAARREARRNQERLMAAIDDSFLSEGDDLGDMYPDGLEYWRAKLGADQAAH